jgi:hypothetical protein
MSSLVHKWLKNKEIAELLGKDPRTIRSWMCCPAKRRALGAVRYGTQCRIPRPYNLDQWVSDARREFKKLCITLEPAWKHALRERARETNRYILEVNRLWLAAYMKVLEHRPIVAQDKQACILLRKAACRILRPLPRYKMDVEPFETEFPAQLASVGLTAQKIQVVMSYWPEPEHFRQVHGARTFAQLEAIRAGVDYLQACRALERMGQKLTAENIRPLLHADIVAHINDTGEQLPGAIVRHPLSTQLQNMLIERVFCKNPPPVIMDYRLPQVGLTRRTAQRRAPQKEQTQRDIRAVLILSGIASALPVPPTRPQTGKTPIRGSAYSQVTHDGGND